METLDLNIITGNKNLFEESIPDFKYLIEQPWFQTNIDLQKKLQYIIILGGGQQVIVTEQDFEEHINRLFKKLLFEYFDSQVDDFCYLTERSWFTKSTNLQMKLYAVCKKGLGNKVNVIAGCFEEHLNEILKQN
jgi:hypothetical protein